MAFAIVMIVVISAVFFAISEIRRGRRYLAIGERVAAYLTYWLYVGIAYYLKEETAIWATYRSISRDKRGRWHRDVVVLETAYNPKNVRFDLEAMVRRRVRWLMKKFYWRTGIKFQLAFTQTTKTEVAYLRRKHMREETPAVEITVSEEQPRATLSENLEEVKFVYLFLGNFGGAVAQQLTRTYDPKEVPFIRVGVYDLDRRRSDRLFDPENADGHLKAWIQDETRFHRPKLGRGIGAGGNPEVAKKAFEEVKEDVLKLTKDASLVVCYACPGGGTGSAVDSLAEMVVAQGIPFWARIVRPFADDGDDTIERFLASYQRLLQIEGICINDSHNEYIFDENNPYAKELREKGVKEALDLLNTKALRPSTESPVDLVCKVYETISRDWNDLIIMIAQSKRSYSLKLALKKYNYREESFDVKKVINDLFDDKFQRPDVIDGARRALVVYPDDISPFDQREITQALAAKMKGGRANHAVEIRKGYSASGDEPAILLFVGSDMSDPAPKILPPWMETAVETLQPVAVIPKKEEEPKEVVSVGTDAGAREIKFVDVAVPVALATELKGFVEEYRSAPLKRRDDAWKALCMKMRPHLSGKQMASLLRVVFKNAAGEKISWHATPLFQVEFKHFQAKCIEGEYTSYEEAARDFSALQMVVKNETGEEMSPETSPYIESALGIAPAHSEKNRLSSIFSFSKEENQPRT